MTALTAKCERTPVPSKLLEERRMSRHRIHEPAAPQQQGQCTRRVVSETAATTGIAGQEVLLASTNLKALSHYADHDLQLLVVELDFFVAQPLQHARERLKDSSGHIPHFCRQVLSSFVFLPSVLRQACEFLQEAKATHDGCVSISGSKVWQELEVYLESGRQILPEQVERLFAVAFELLRDAQRCVTCSQLTTA